MVAKQQSRKLYRTMQGRLVDLDKLRASNENVRAVGNMNVNARGDVIGASGQIVKSKETTMKEYYKAPRKQVSDTPAPTTVKVAKQPTAKSTPQVINTQTLNTVQKSQKTTSVFKPKKGIDAALDGVE